MRYKTTSELKKSGFWRLLPAEVKEEILTSNKKPVLQKSMSNSNWKSAEQLQQRTLYEKIREKFPSAVWEASNIIPNRKFRADILIPDSKIIIEFDGYRHHGLSKQGFQKGLERQNLLVLHGYKVLRYHYQQVSHEIEGIIDQVLQLDKLYKQQKRSDNAKRTTKQSNQANWIRDSMGKLGNGYKTTS